MKRKLKTLTEQLTEARSNYDRILGRNDKQLMTEQKGGKINDTNPDGKIELPRGTKTDYAGMNGDGPTLIPPSKDQLTAGMSPQLDEQGNQACNNGGAYMTLGACPNSLHWTGTYIYGPWHCYCCKIDGQTPVPGQIGDIIDYGPMNGSFGPNNYEILSVSPGLPTSWQGNMYSTPYCCADPVQTGQGGCITPPSNGIGVNGRYVVLNYCDCDPTTGVGCYNPGGASNNATGGAWMAATVCMTVDNGQVPQVGQTVNVPSSQNMTPGMVITQAATHPYCTADPGMGVTPGDPGTIGNFYDWSTMGPCPTTTPCDTSTSSPCAVQWWQNPNATWAANWITNNDCTTYTWPALNLETQANAIMATAPTPVLGPYNNATDIWAAANASGLVNPQKGQFIGKMAKAKYSQCQKQACNC